MWFDIAVVGEITDPTVVLRASLFDWHSDPSLPFSAIHERGCVTVEERSHPFPLRGRHRQRSLPRPGIGQVAFGRTPECAFLAVYRENVRGRDLKLARQAARRRAALHCCADCHGRVVRDEVALPVLRRNRREMTPQRASRARLTDIDVRAATGRKLKREHCLRWTAFEQLADCIVTAPHAFGANTIFDSTRSHAMAPQFGGCAVADVHLNCRAAKR